MESGLLSPKIDYVFKKIFSSEEHPKILISFLNAILNQKDEITRVQVINSDSDDKKYEEDDEISRLRVKATTINREVINIEIQIKNEPMVIEKSLHNWGKFYEEQLKGKDRYDELSRTVCINILDKKYFKNDKFHNGYKLKEMDTYEDLTDLLEIHYIELSKMRKLDKNEQKIDILEAWVEFLRNPQGEVIKILEKEYKSIKEALDELYKLSRDNKVREVCYMRDKSLKDIVNAEEKGIEKGILESAKKLLGILDNYTISETLGIDVKIVQKLRDGI